MTTLILNHNSIRYVSTKSFFFLSFFKSDSLTLYISILWCYIYPPVILRYLRYWLYKKINLSDNIFYIAARRFIFFFFLLVFMPIYIANICRSLLPTEMIINPYLLIWNFSILKLLLYLLKFSLLDKFIYWVYSS